MRFYHNAVRWYPSPRRDPGGFGGVGGGEGEVFEWSGDALRSRPIALSRITQRLFTCQRRGLPGGLGKWGGASSLLLRPPALLSLLPPGHPPPILHFRCLSSHNYGLCPPPPPCRGERDRRDLLALAINPSCQRVNLSPAGLAVRLRLTITASDGKKCIFFMSLQLKERYLLTRLDGRECVGCSIKN